MVVNEAMCCGCPVMASNRVGAARDLVLPVAPEFVFPVGDVESLAKKLSAVATNRERLQQVRQSALELIREWSPEKTTEGLIRAIEAGVARVRGS